MKNDTLLKFGSGIAIGAIVGFGAGFSRGSAKSPSVAEAKVETKSIVVNDRRDPKDSVTAPTATPQPKKSEPEPSAAKKLLTIYDFDPEKVEELCTGRWAKQGKLREHGLAHCRKAEKSAYMDLMDLVGKINDESWASGLLSSIWEEWTKRGVTQYSMVNHALETEYEAFLDIQYERKQPGYRQQEMKSCFEQWGTGTSRFTMTMHCYKQQAE